MTFYSSAEATAGATYYYILNLQGDVVQIINNENSVLANYRYDAWGKLLAVTDKNGNAITDKKHIGNVNPIRYRGYFYDTETGLYYCNSRYYDPETCRWISPEPNVYMSGFDAGAGLAMYNVYAYCANNPVIFCDRTGEFILTAIIVGVVAGAVVGGTVGGVVAYKSAKESGAEGSDLFCATVKGAGKGAVVGGAGGGLIGATGGVIAVYGATSVAGTAMISGTASITARTVEVASLQIKKSKAEGKNANDIMNDVIDSTFNNGGKIIGLTPLTKSSAIGVKYYTNSELVEIFGGNYTLDDTLKAPSGKVISYAFVAYACFNAVRSLFCDDPIVYATKRGYRLN